MVFCYQNCSDLLLEKKCYSKGEKILKFEAENLQTFRNHYLCRTIYSNSERSEQVLVIVECLFNLLLEVCQIQFTSDQLEFKLKKIIGI